MPQYQLTLAHIQEVDHGKPASAFNHALRQIVQDVLDRAGDRSKRKVVLVIEAEPIIDKATGCLDSVAIQFHVRTRVPDRQTRQYPMLANNEGVLHFESNSPMDPRQHDLPFAGGDAKVEKTEQVEGDQAE